MSKILQQILKIEFILNVYKKKDHSYYLILGNQNQKLLNKFLDKNKKILYLDISKKKLNIIFFFNIFNFINFFKIFIYDNFSTAFYYQSIVIYNPKCIITFYDNDINFYNLKKYFYNKKFISIQNGSRSLLNDMFGHQELINNKTLQADYICVFNEKVKKIYQKYIKAKVIVIGSFKNNMVRKKNNFFDTPKLAYISQYRKVIFENQMLYFWKERKITPKEFYKNHKILFKAIKFFCKKFNITLNIICSSNYISEKKYFRSLLGDTKIRFLDNKKDNLTVYTQLNNFNLVISEWSTLGYESLARDKKTCFFRQKILNLEDRSFGWPDKTLKETFFYTENTNEKKILEILNNLSRMSLQEWLSKTSYLRNKVMYYDYQNSKFKKLISNV